MRVDDSVYLPFVAFKCFVKNCSDVIVPLVKFWIFLGVTLARFFMVCTLCFTSLQIPVIIVISSIMSFT